MNACIPLRGVSTSTTHIKLPHQATTHCRKSQANLSYHEILQAALLLGCDNHLCLFRLSRLQTGLYFESTEFEKWEPDTGIMNE